MSSDVKWVLGTLCRNPSSGGCLEYHPGAAGCFRSNDDNAGQQCCYGSDGKLLPAGSRGVGTPDKKYGNWKNMYDHCTMPMLCHSTIVAKIARLILIAIITSMVHEKETLLTVKQIVSVLDESTKALLLCHIGVYILAILCILSYISFIQN